jgi:hypothetical protein
MSASIGGAPLDMIVRTSATTFTAVTPPHVADANLTLSVVTSAGTFILKNAYTYTNGIVITPNTAPRDSTAVSVYVVGVGFTVPNFSPTTSDAHIYLVDGAYDATNNAGAKTNGQVAECTNVLVISDTELICGMDLTHSVTPAGTFAAAAARTVNDGVANVGSTTFTSATAKFSSADVGLVLSVASNTEVTAGTTIASVTNPTTVVLSAAAIATGTAVVTTLGGPRTVTAVTADGSTTITGAFKTGDVGRVISGSATGIAPFTTIVAVTPGVSATLSTAAADIIGTTGSGAVIVGNATPVVDGAYTMTFVTNGIVDAATVDVTNYSQSIITSASTFTVAAY